MADITLNVGGMSCSGCADSVTRAVTRVAPDARVVVDLASGRVDVSGAPSREVVAAAIEKAGYDIKS